MTIDRLARIVGLDYGEKRIGVALSDALGIAAHPWGMLDHTADWKGQLTDLLTAEGITTVVVGMPLTLRGEKGPKAKEVEVFISEVRALQEGIEVIEWDERFTTSIAQKTLLDLEPRKSRRSQKTGRIDAMAAAVMLQSFLDSTKHSRVC